MKITDPNIYGNLAILLGIISFLPIMVKISRSKKTNNFTWLNLSLALISNIMWIIYGICSSSIANIVSGVLYFIIYSFIVIYKYVY